jgi:hypothetical protein
LMCSMLVEGRRSRVIQQKSQQQLAFLNCNCFI